ncbi:hypothetical protein MYX82_14045 [Acidobacteria bacterium AH-259-D05]|nr:hypothetical protein [Acidobacteria bacterium AH-259-D05]
MVGTVLMIILVVRVTAAYSPQLSESDGDQNRIMLNGAVATADQEVRLHMRFTAARGIKINQLRVQITFPVPELTFIGFELPYPAEKVGAQFSVQEMESNRVQVEVRVPENSQEALPEEGVAYLVFRIADNVEPVPLTIVVEHIEMKDLKGESLEVVRNSETQINVVSEELYPLIACFFYMH